MPIIETRGSLSSRGYGQFAQGGAAPVAGAFIEDVFSTTLYGGTGAAQSIANGIALGTGATSAGWIGTLGGSGSEIGYSVAVDSSGNVYVCGRSEASGTIDFIIAKYNTSGTIQWQRSLSGSGIDIGLSVAVDSSGNVYVCGRSNASGTNDFIIAKYNTSGVIQWQRSLGGSGTDIGNSVAVDSSGNVYVCGYSVISGRVDLIIAKLPGDGSGTGAYNVGGATFTYAASTLTDAASTLTDAASTLTDAASTLTDATSTLTDAAATLNSNVTPLAEGAGRGGLVWIKGRSTTSDHALYDTTRGATADLVSNSTAAQTTQAQGLTAFLGSGFSIGTLAKLNTSAAIYAAWTFAEQSKFFDVVTYTGTGVNRTVTHNLGSVPGCIIVKSLGTGDWQVYHRSLANTQYLVLNTTAAAATGATRWNSTTPTATEFSLGTDTSVNGLGNNYVAYLFAHDAGGFGASGTDNVISCGSYTGNGSATGPIVTLGWEPQFLIIKRASGGSGSWGISDNIRGLTVGADTRAVFADLTQAENASVAVTPTATGFQLTTTSAQYNASGSTYIYIAIRRGPMRTPTLGTNVFMPTVYTGTNVNNRLVNTSIAPDMVWMRQRNDTVLEGMVVGDRLRGQPYLLTGSTAAEVTSATAFDQQNVSGTEYGSAFASMNGVWVGNNATAKLNVNTTANNHIAEAFRRAPGFFDVVCYTGTGVARTVNHNLGVVPELWIIKRRNSAESWAVGGGVLGSATDNYVLLSDPSENITTTSLWQMPTATTIGIGAGAPTWTGINGNASTYVAYLFASCPGVSKVGTYTGTGSTVQVDCGFTAGARFVLIKRTDSAGDWYVWDSARGIIAANDPYLVLNSTAAEVTGTDWVDTLATGFEVSNAGSNLVNVSGGTYLFLAVS